MIPGAPGTPGGNPGAPGNPTGGVGIPGPPERLAENHSEVLAANRAIQEAPESQESPAILQAASENHSEVLAADWGISYIDSLYAWLGGRPEKEGGHKDVGQEQESNDDGVRLRSFSIGLLHRCCRANRKTEANLGRKGSEMMSRD